jgi:hypothetical protein
MPFIDLFDDPDEVGKVIIAVQKAIVEHFTEADWTELAYETGTQDYLLRHKRLLRSLNWGDDDYGSCVFEVLRHFSEEKLSAFQALITHPKVQPDVERDCAGILYRIGIGTGHVAPVSALALSAPDVVARALIDADTLLRTSGPISCVDRLHTALHGYFRSLCDRASLAPLAGASLPALFKLLRTQHPALQNLGSQDQDIARVLSGFASVVDALNTIRNNASVAHPNEDLLGEAEALLRIGARSQI